MVTLICSFPLVFSVGSISLSVTVTGSLAHIVT